MAEKNDTKETDAGAITKSTQNELATIAPAVANMVLALSLCKREELRRPRDTFEMVADKQFMDVLIEVSAALEALRYHRRGKNRFKVFASRTIRSVFDRAIAELDAQDFDIDQWYFDTLPVEYKVNKDPVLEDAMKMTADCGEMKIDWLYELQKLDQKWPGIVLTIRNCIDNERTMQNRMKGEWQSTVKLWSSEPMAKMGADIYKHKPASKPRGIRSKLY